MPKHQFSLELISHQVHQSVIQQRSSDGYINATQLCDVAAKKWHSYRMLEPTGHFLRALSAKIGIKELTEELAGQDGRVHVWVHPQVALHLAQWLSADFAVQVTEWVALWMSGGGRSRSANTAASLPYHLQRHVQNVGKVPPTHFSILQELTTTLIAPLEAQGYTMPESMLPDVSQGLMFCKFARTTLGINTDELPTYEHAFPDGRVVSAKLYPVEHLGQFRTFINNVWMPERAEEYFKKRDPQALPLLDKVLRISFEAPKPRTKRRA